MKHLVIAAHGCPIHSLGPYGNEWIATPNLDRLAAEGEVFDRHYSARPDPVATRRAWWAYLPAGAVLIRASREQHDAPAEAYSHFAEVIDARPGSGITASSVLQRLGESSELVWIESDFLLPPWNISQAVFDVYLEELTEEAQDAAEPVPPWSDPETDWFDRDDGDAWELLHRSYAAAVTAFDAEVGRILEAIPLDDVTVAFTSDFGFPLGEHGLLGPHRPWLHDEFVHLPLITRRPNAASGRREWAFTQPEDLLSILNGTPTVQRQSVVTRWEVNGASEASLRTDTHALLLPLAVPEGDDPREPMLFEKPDDRWEVNDVRQANLELADELEAELRKRLG